LASNKQQVIWEELEAFVQPENFEKK